MLTLGEESSRAAEASGGVPSEAGAKVPLRGQGRGRGRGGRGRVPAAPLGGGAGRVLRGGDGLHEQDEASLTFVFCSRRVKWKCRQRNGGVLSNCEGAVEHLTTFADVNTHSLACKYLFVDTPRAVVDDFVDNWGEDMLGPLAELVLPSAPTDGDGGGAGGGGFGFGEEKEGLSELWPRLSRICEGMEDLEASRTKVELARQLVVDKANPESISHALDKVRLLPLCEWDA